MKSNTRDINSANRSRNNYSNNNSNDQPWKNDLTVRVPWKFWKKMSDEEKRKRIQACKEKKRAQRNVNTATTQANASASAPAVTPTIPSSSNGSVVSEIPSIRSIMAAQTVPTTSNTATPWNLYQSGWKTIHNKCITKD